MKTGKKDERSQTLVLGGGGLLGAAWEAGLVAGLAEEGLDIAKFDRIIGTSSGAIIGSQLGLGRTPEYLFMGQLAMAEKFRTQNPGPSAGTPPSPAWQAEMTRELQEAYLAGEVPKELMAKIGRLAVETELLPEERFLDNFRPMFRAGEDWPEKFACITIDAADGTLAVWDRGSGVDLLHAVAASAASPFFTRPVHVGGRECMDGGLRSTTNADLAEGAGSVLIAAPALAFMPGLIAQVRREIAVIGQKGGNAVLIAPDRSSVVAMGSNPMDGKRGDGVARAACNQGKEEFRGLDKEIFGKI